MATVTVGWGRCTIRVKKYDDDTASWESFATPVEDSTQLETEEGDKLEAAIEGGGNEAVKYKKSTYQLQFQMRQVPERTDPITDTDGVVDDEYTVQVIPENEDAIGLEIPRAAVHVQTAFDTEDGITKTYIFDALTVSDGTATITLGAISTDTTE